MNGPQCTECGGWNECNHGMERTCCPSCLGDAGERDDGVCAACEADADRMLADRAEATRDRLRFGNDTFVVRAGR